MMTGRPLTKNMLKSLLECYIRQIMGTPARPFSTKYSKGLIERGMVEVRSRANGTRSEDALCVTKTGREIIEPIYRMILK